MGESAHDPKTTKLHSSIYDYNQSMVHRIFSIWPIRTIGGTETASNNKTPTVFTLSHSLTLNICATNRSSRDLLF